VRLFIQNAAGLVHMLRPDNTTCRIATRDPVRVEISPAQAHIFKLDSCGVCWPDPRSYERYVSRGW